MFEQRTARLLPTTCWYPVWSGPRPCSVRMWCSLPSAPFAPCATGKRQADSSSSNTAATERLKSMTCMCAFQLNADQM
jgi:hypothetical protein